METQRWGAAVLRERDAPRARKEDRGKICDHDQRERTERPRRRGAVQGTDRRGEWISTTQGRAGNAADLSPDRAASQGPHLRRGAGAAAPKTSGPTAQRGGSRSVPGAGDGGIVDWPAPHFL